MSLSDQVSDQVGQARNFFDKWLGEHNGNESFPTRLNDAQKESLLWIAVSFIFAAAFWKGVPRDYYQVEVWDLDKNGQYKLEDAFDEYGRPVQYRRIGILQPIKYLTVLYHEICHALVGAATGGKVTLIIVDWNEGGATFFASKKDHIGQPSLTLTLPAGYVGSCLIGCAFVFAGFDVVASEIAAIGFAVITLLSTVVCAAVLPKALFRHHKYATRLWLAKLWRQEAAIEKYTRLREEREREKDAEWAKRFRETGEGGRSKGAEADEKKKKDDQARVASIQLIVLTTTFIGSIIAVAWALYDSLYLRFVILYLGTINALYAIWDIYLDGIKYGKTVASDCTAMARKFNNNKLKKNKNAKMHTTGYYAKRWLAAEITMFMGTIFLALYVWTDPMAEQALRSRSSFLATSSHYTPGDLLESAKANAAGMFDK